MSLYNSSGAGFRLDHRILDDFLQALAARAEPRCGGARLVPTTLESVKLHKGFTKASQRYQLISTVLLSNPFWNQTVSKHRQMVKCQMNQCVHRRNTTGTISKSSCPHRLWIKAPFFLRYNCAKPHPRHFQQMQHLNNLFLLSQGMQPVRPGRGGSPEQFGPNLNLNLS